jgi:hypothetical protein
VQQDQTDWDDVLPWVTYVYNTTVSTAHSKCPFELVMNRSPNSITRDKIGDNLKGIKLQIAEHLQTRIKQTQKLVNIINTERKLSEELQANKSRAEPTPYNIGDVVWVTSHTRLWDGAKRKLAKAWRGPWVVTAIRGPVTIVGRCLGSDEGSSAMHVSNVKPFLGSNGKIANIAVSVMKREKDNEGVENNDAEKTEWEVQKIIGHRIRGQQEMEFQIKWKGYIKPTWAGEHELACSTAVEAYFSKIVHA